MENTKYGRRREGRWTSIRAKAQDTRTNPNSWETHLVRKIWDIGLLRALSLRIMMVMLKLIYNWLEVNGLQTGRMPFSTHMNESHSKRCCPTMLRRSLFIYVWKMNVPLCSWSQSAHEHSACNFNIREHRFQVVRIFFCTTQEQSHNNVGPMSIELDSFNLCNRL